MRCASGAAKASYSDPGVCVDRVVHHHPDPLGLRVVDIHKLAHALGKVDGGALLRDLDLAPGLVRVEDHEQVHCTLTPVLVVIALHLPWLR